MYGPMIKREFRLADGERFEVDGGRLAIVGPDGTRRTVKVGRLMADPDDWRSLVAAVAELEYDSA